MSMKNFVLGSKEKSIRRSACDRRAVTVATAKTKIDIYENARNFDRQAVSRFGEKELTHEELERQAATSCDCCKGKYLKWDLSYL